MATSHPPFFDGAGSLGARTFGLARRLVPPLFTDAFALARAKFATDPFRRLVDEHRQVAAMLDELERSDGLPRAARAGLFMRVKRALTKHALAEEDFVYPMLHDELGDVESSKALYADHADIKIHLFETEQAVLKDEGWLVRVVALREVFMTHVRQEEEVEFPKLQEALDQRRQRWLSMNIRREELMMR